MEYIQLKQDKLGIIESETIRKEENTYINLRLCDYLHIFVK